MSIFSIAFSLFLIANPLGNSPAIVALIRDFSFDRQKQIMMRESFFALVLALFFQMFGEVFLGTLQIREYSVSICGGLLMIIIAVNMIFPKTQEANSTKLTRDPVFVPIATPLISGPGVLTIIMLYSNTVESQLSLTLAILLSFAMVTIVLIASPYLQKILKTRGMIALEQLMGLVLWMLAIGLIQKGITLLINEYTTQGV
ncbi:MAG: MarC family protein [Waddliaceae bacterium]